MTLVFAAIAPHGTLPEAPVPGADTTHEALAELGRRFDAATPEATIVLSPHNVHVVGHFAVVLAGALSGSLAAQFYIARDERRAILVSQFRAQEHLGGFQQTEAFLAHRERLRPMLDGAQSSLYTLAYAREPQPAPLRFAER